MNITELLKNLGISKWSAAWSFVTGGWSGLAKLVCEAFTKILKRANPDQLTKYSELTIKLAMFIRYGINLFVTDEKIKTAAEATAKAVEELAEHIKDGNYDESELDKDIENIEACIDAWKKVSRS